MKSEKINPGIWNNKIILFASLIILVAAIVIAVPSFHTYGTTSYLTEDQDQVFEYNFTSNVTNDENDSLIFEFVNITVSPDIWQFNGPSDYYWISLDQGTGVMIFNSTKDNETGDFNISVFVHNSQGDGQSSSFYFNVNATNDPPQFQTLENWSVNSTEPFEVIVYITDEETNTPYSLNITFTECSVAEWSDRDITNCTLITEDDYSFDETAGILNISFTPSRNDVGSYIVNFSVTDNSSLGNATGSEVINISVENINLAPYFTYTCDNEGNGSEDSAFTCWINATDIDEIYSLTFEANYSWFLFNDSSNSITEVCNESTDYSAGAFVNFTPTDSEVGNWSVNITVTDVGYGLGVPKFNTTTVWFYFDNVEDPVFLDPISDATIYEDYDFYIYAYDDDLLVPDPSVKTETLTFASNESWVSVSSYSASGNTTTGLVSIDYSIAASLSGDANYTIVINVTDTSSNVAETNFTIEILGDTPVEWNDSIGDVFEIYEDNEIYLNLSENISDAEGDTISFSFISDNSFPNFTIDSSTGEIDITPEDVDVGSHNVTINASDGKLDSLRSFNFTIYNINDNPVTEPLLEENGATVNETDSSVNTTEDSSVDLYLYIHDEDFKIPNAQKGFYNETFNVSTTIQGPNEALFEFVAASGWPVAGSNRTKYDASFTPNRSDLGDYNITVNITDASNSSILFEFNLTITSIAHTPVMMNLTNFTSAINREFYYQINATDVEDGDSTLPENSNFTFSYDVISGEDVFTSALDTTSGEINITFSETQGGIYHLNMTVNDSDSFQDSKDFWIYVYDYPNITSPASDYEFSLIENTTNELNFTVNHSVANNLTYEIYILDSNYNNVLRYNLSYYGDGTELSWSFVTNYTDETYNNVLNITLIVYPDSSELENPLDLNTTVVWNLTINHSNAPVELLTNIGTQSRDYNSIISLDLEDYFYDIDNFDAFYNQTINVTLESNTTPTSIAYSVSNWNLNLTSLVQTPFTEWISVNISDFDDNNDTLTSAISNVFKVEFTAPESIVTEVPTPSGGGGGAKKPIALKIILPDPVSVYRKDKIVVPITLSNQGQMILNEINLSGLVIKNQSVKSGVNISFETDYFQTLGIGEKKNTTMTILIDTDEAGLYEININASVSSPKYEDWGTLYLTVKEADSSEAMEKILFTEEFIAENPECIEIQEVIDDARILYQQGRMSEAIEEADNAITACKSAISQPGSPIEVESRKNDIYKYITFSFIFVVLIILGIYLYKRKSLRRTEVK